METEDSGRPGDRPLSYSSHPSGASPGHGISGVGGPPDLLSPLSVTNAPFLLPAFSAHRLFLVYRAVLVSAHRTRSPLKCERPQRLHEVSVGGQPLHKHIQVITLDRLILARPRP